MRIHKCFYDNDYVFEDDTLTKQERIMSVIYITYYGYCHTCHRKYTWTEAFVQNRGDDLFEEVNEKPLTLNK